jgi:heat shock protein HtpX
MYSEIAHNKRKSILIISLFILIIAGLADIFDYAYAGGSPAVLIGVVIGAIIYSTISYFAGMRLSLAINSAKEIKKQDNPRLWRIIENLSIADGLPMPRVFIMDDPAPNAFATGRDPKHAAVCATSGLLEIMNDDELTGVFAHELGHVKNYDSRVSMIAFALMAAISLIADILLQMSFFRGGERNEEDQIALFIGIAAAVLAPLVAFMIQMAVSRQREYLADATGALTTRYPEGLISALKKIERTGSTLKKQNTATAHFFFANPLKAHTITNLFSTHPPIEDRIKRLENMETHA